MAPLLFYSAELMQDKTSIREAWTHSLSPLLSGYPTKAAVLLKGIKKPANIVLHRRAKSPRLQQRVGECIGKAFA